MECTAVLWYLWSTGSRNPSWIPESAGARVKWCHMMNTVGSLYLWITLRGLSPGGKG